MPTINAYYAVNISSLVGPSFGDGFIDNTTVEQYMAKGSYPVTDADTLSKNRANIRYQMVVDSISTMTSIGIYDANAVGAAANIAPSAFSFTLRTDDNNFATRDELNPGQYLMGANAVTRCVARALLSNYTVNVSNFNPTSNTVGVAGAIDPANYGSIITAVTAGPLAANLAQAMNAVTVSIIYTPPIS